MAAGTRTEGFFKCWTRKEAYIKARGTGLQMSLRSFDVKIASDEPQSLLDERGGLWSLYSFTPVEGWIGALAVRGTDKRVRYFEWRGDATEEIRANASEVKSHA